MRVLTIYFKVLITVVLRRQTQSVDRFRPPPRTNHTLLNVFPKSFSMKNVRLRLLWLNREIHQNDLNQCFILAIINTPSIIEIFACTICVYLFNSSCSISSRVYEERFVEFSFFLFYQTRKYSTLNIKILKTTSNRNVCTTIHSTTE